MAILIAQNSNGNNYTFGSPNSDNAFFGLNNQAETINFSGAGNLKIFDVSYGDTLNLLGTVVSSGNPVNISVSGNIVTLVAGASTYTLGSFNSGELTTINFANQSITITATTTNSATTYSYTSLEPGSTPRNVSATPKAIIFDNTKPIVGTIAIASATSISNGYLNAGDVVSVTVPFSEAVTVTGTPTLDLVINATTVQAIYDTTTSTANSLIFKYTIFDGQNDTGGISIPANALKQVGTSTIKDAAGNDATLTTVVVSDNTSYKVDTNAPTVTITTPTTTNDTTPVIGGTAEAGSTVTVSVNSKTYTTIADVTTGSWAVGVTTPFAIGNHTYAVSVTAIDPAGNTSTTPATQSLIIDTGAKATATPIEKAGYVVLTNGVNAAEAGGNIVITAGLANTGAKADDTIELLLNGVSIVTHTLNADEITANSYDFTIAGSLLGGDGTKLLSTKVSTFNTIPSSPLNFVVDKTILAPTGLDLAAADDTGVDADNITKNTNGLTISGAGETGASVALFDDVNGNGVIDASESLGTATVTAGAWTRDIVLASGAHSIKAIQTDIAGNISAASSALNITVDTTLPTLSNVTIASNNGNTAQAKTGDVVTLRFSASETLGALPVVSILGGTATVTNSGNSYTATYTVAGTESQGAAPFSINFLDVAANAGIAVTAVTNSSSVNVDYTAPAVPSVTGITDDTGIAGDKITSDTSLVISGVAEANSTVTVSLGGTPLTGTVIANAQGAWSYDYTGTVLSQGNYAFTATARDAAGNTSTASTALAVTVDTVAPTVTVSSSDTALKIGDTSVVTFTFSEAVTDFAVADITVGNGTITGPLSSDGITWSATLTPSANITSLTNVISVNQTGVTDLAGNAGVGTTASENYTIDTAVPTVTVSSSDTALKIGDTSVVTFTFSEAVTGFTSADITVGNGTITGPVSSDGITWTATLTPSADTTATTNVISVNTIGVKDLVGNAGVGTTASENYTIDTAAPSTPTLTEVTSKILDGYLNASEAISTTFKVTLPTTGSLAVAGDTVEILSNNLAFSTPKAVVLVGNDITAGYVNVAISSAELGSDGSKSLTAKIIDVAGNVGAASSALAFVLDTTAPTAPTTVLLSPVGGNVVENTLNNTNTSLTATALITTGQATGGSAVLKINGTIVATDAFIAPNDTTVTFSVGDATTITTGGTATVEITDLAGNTTASSASSNPTLMVNRTSSTLVASVPSISVDNGSSATDLKTNQAVQTITSTLSRALSGEVLYGSTNNGVNWTDITSKVSTTALTWDGAVLAVGSNNISLKVKNSATGNETLLNTAGYTLDTVAPIHAPTFALLTDSGVLSSDGISSTGTLTVTAPTGGFETNARWDYSLDGGQIWSSVQGTGVTSFTLPVGSYEIGAVQVRHIDESGNASTPTTNAAKIVIDQTSPTASVTTAVVKNGVADKVVVQSTEKGVAYLVKNSVNVTNEASITGASDTNFNSVSIVTANTNTDLLTTGLVDGTYNLYTVDEAGNLSTVSTNSIVVDTTAPVVTITGASFIQKNLTTENTIRLAGTGFNLLLTTGKEIVGGDINDARFDWTELSWIVTGTTAQAIISSDIAAVKVNSATELDIVLKPTNALYSNLNFLTGGTAVADTLAITAGFLKDAAGNAAVVANAGAQTSMSAVTVDTETLFKMNLLNGTNAPTIYVPKIELIAPTTQANGVDFDNTTFDGTNLKATPTSVITVTGIQAGQTVTLNHLQKMSYVAGQNTINLSALATNTTTEKVVLNLIDTKGIGINNNSNVQTDMTLNGGSSYVFLGTGVDIINLVDSSPNVSPAGSLSIDSIENFASGVDKVYLSKAIFTVFTNDVIGNMTANSKVATGATAPVGESSGKNIWINDDGTIFYDADGNWSDSSVALISILTLNGGAITASDLYLV